MSDRPLKTCDECGSLFFPESSRMDALCPECSHLLYGYDPCVHTFVGGRCSKCHWDGAVSDYLRRRTQPPTDQPINDLLKMEIVWARAGDCFEWSALVGVDQYLLRMNDFPDEPLYTVYWGGQQIDLDDPPSGWVIPR